MFAWPVPYILNQGFEPIHIKSFLDWLFKYLLMLWNIFSNIFLAILFVLPLFIYGYGKQNKNISIKSDKVCKCNQEKNIILILIILQIDPVTHISIYSYVFMGERQLNNRKYEILTINVLTFLSGNFFRTKFVLMELDIYKHSNVIKR